MAILTDKVVRNWDMQAIPLMEKEKELQDKLDALPPKKDGGGFFDFFNGFGNPNSRQGLESRLSSIQCKQLQLAQVFTLRILKQAAGTDGKFNKRYSDYKRQREAECPHWPMTMSPDEQRKDYLLRYFLLQRVSLPKDQEHVVDQMLDFYKHDKSLPKPYRPDKDIDNWLKQFDL